MNMELEKFDQLLSRVEHLLARVEKLDKQNQELSSRLTEKDKEIESLKESAVVMQREKAHISSKIDELLSRIDRAVG